MSHKPRPAQDHYNFFDNVVEYASQSEDIYGSIAQFKSSKKTTVPLSSLEKQIGAVTTKAFGVNPASEAGNGLGIKPLTLQTAKSDSKSSIGSTPAGLATNQGMVSVLSPSTTVNGYTQAELGDEWWKAIYSIPIDKHFGVVDDGTDSRGRRGSVEKALEAQFNQSTLFIGGAFSDESQTLEPQEIQRTIVLPNNGKATVFLPLLNGCFDNVVEVPGQGGLSELELLDSIHTVFNAKGQGGAVTRLFASVDGVKVKDLSDYRQSSGVPFAYTVPFPIENSLISSYGVTNEWYLDNKDSSTQLSELAAGDTVTIGPAVSDGYWLAVDVAGGDHTLNFGGALNIKGPIFSLDITYNILNPIYGSDGGDTLTGTTGNDYIDGGIGNDYITGNRGDDLLVGGSGMDTIDGGIGSDELWGDDGLDTFIFKKGYGKDSIFDFIHGETVQTEIRTFPVAVKDVALPSGLSAQLDFGGGDILTFAGVQSSSLAIQPGLITFI